MHNICTVDPLTSDFISLRAPNGYRQLSSCQWYQKGDLMLVVGSVNADTPSSSRLFISIFDMHLEPPVWTMMIVPGDVTIYPSSYGWNLTSPSVLVMTKLFMIIWNELTRMRLNGISSEWSSDLASELAQIFISPQPALNDRLIIWDLGWSSCDPVDDPEAADQEQINVRGRMRVYRVDGAPDPALSLKAYAYATYVASKSYSNPSGRSQVAYAYIRPNLDFVNASNCADVAYSLNVMYLLDTNTGGNPINSCSVIIQPAGDRVALFEGVMPLFQDDSVIKLDSITDALSNPSYSVDKAIPLCPSSPVSSWPGNALYGHVIGISLPLLPTPDDPTIEYQPVADAMTAGWGDEWAAYGYEMCRYRNLLPNQWGRLSKLILICVSRCLRQDLPVIHIELDGSIIERAGLLVSYRLFETFIPEFDMLDTAEVYVLEARAGDNYWHARPATWGDLVQRASAVQAQLLSQYSNFSVDFIPSGPLFINPVLAQELYRDSPLTSTMKVRGKCDTTNNVVDFNYSWSTPNTANSLLKHCLLPVELSDYLNLSDSDYALWLKGSTLYSYLGQTANYRPTSYSLNLYQRICPIPSEASSAGYTFVITEQSPCPDYADGYAEAGVIAEDQQPSRISPQHNTWMRVDTAGIVYLHALRITPDLISQIAL